jgi:hypothetical protein
VRLAQQIRGDDLTVCAVSLDAADLSSLSLGMPIYLHLANEFFLVVGRADDDEANSIFLQEVCGPKVIEIMDKEQREQAFAAGILEGSAGRPPVDENTSDGYHTFAELYAHRNALWIALCGTMQELERGITWRAKKQQDGKEFKGYFLLGISKRAGLQITYHLPDAFWNKCEFAETLDVAPPYDGHTGPDVLKRLSRLL